MTMCALLSLVRPASAADVGVGLEVITSAPPVGWELTPQAQPGDGIHLVAAVREFEPFAIGVDRDLWYASSTEEVYRVLAELLPLTGLDMSLATLVATVDDGGAELPGFESRRIWQFEQQLEGAPVVGAGVAVVTEDGAVRRVEGALFLDRGPANLPHLEADAAAERAVEAVHGGEVAAVLPVVLPVGSELRHTWYVLVETEEGGYEVRIDAETGDVLQLLLPQLGQRLPFGIIIGNGPLLGHDAAGATGVRLDGVSLVGGRLVRQ
jgi:hypothetical protein